MNKFEDYHYEAISKLQYYYGKRLSNKYEKLKSLCKDKLSFLEKMKEKQFYTTKEQKMLNHMRKQYQIDRKEFGKNFEGMDVPFGPQGAVI